MALTKCTVTKGTIGALGTTAAERALTDQQFKDKFDYEPDGTIDFVNDTLTVELDTALSGKAASSHTHAESTITFTDITTNNADVSKHGYLPKLGGGTSNFLRADGTWASPATGAKIASGYVAAIDGTVDITSYGFASVSAVILTSFDNSGAPSVFPFVTAYSTTAFTFNSTSIGATGTFWMVIGT